MVRLFRDYGYRRLRSKARLKFLLADWGPVEFREVLENEYLGHALPDGPAPAAATDPGRPHRRPRAEGRPLYVGAAPVVGRVTGETLAGLADLMDAAGATGCGSRRTRSSS